MLSALESITCFDLMRQLTRANGHFTVRDLITNTRPDHSVRAFIRLCLDRAAIELSPIRRASEDRKFTGYRTTALLPPILEVHVNDIARVRLELTRRLGGRATDQAVFQQQSALWTALRALRNVESRAIAFYASTEERPITVQTARFWLNRLAQAEYLTAHGDGHFTLRPTRNHGPAPVLVRGGLVLDLNLMRAVNVTAQPSLDHTGRAA